MSLNTHITLCNTCCAVKKLTFISSSKCLLVILFVVIGFQSIAQNRFWVATVNANWNSNNWSATSGGAPDGLGAPAAGEIAVFNGNGTGNCLVDVAVGISGIDVNNGYTGTIDINGQSFVINGTGTYDFADGTITDGTGTSILDVTTTGDVRISGTLFDIQTDLSGRRLDLDGSTFNEIAYLEQTGTNGTYGNGGNVFQDSVTLVNSGTNECRLANGAVGDIFNGPVFINNTGTGYIRMAYNGAGNQFNDHVYLSSSSGNGIRFGEGAGTSVLAAGMELRVQGVYSAGNLTIRNLQQLGGNAQTLTLTGTASLRLTNCDFSGEVNFTAPRLFTVGTNYQDKTRLNKNGAGHDGSTGGNYFADSLWLVNTGTGYLLMGNGNPDSCMASVYMENASTHNLYFAYNSAGNYIDGNLEAIASSAGTGDRLYLSSIAVSTLTITGDLSITNESSRANSSVHVGQQGDVDIAGDVMVLINNAATTSGTAYVGTDLNSTINIGGDLTVNITGSCGNCNAYIGNNGDVNITGNVLANNQGTGTTTQILFANGGNSRVNITGNITANNTATLPATTRMYLGNNGNLTVDGITDINNSSASNNSQVFCSDNDSCFFNGDIRLESSNVLSDGIFFGNGNGITMLANGQSIYVDPEGFVSGQLQLRNFNQLGATAQSIVLTGNAYMNVHDANWEAVVNLSSPRITTRGTVYQSVSTLNKTGAVNDASVGGNVFHANANLNNNGSGYFVMGNTNPDTFLVDLNINNLGSNAMHVANNSSGNLVQGNVNLVNAGSATTFTTANSNGASLTVNGNFVVSNTSSANSNITLAGNGSLTIDGDLELTNAGSGNASYLNIANGTNSSVVINGKADISMAGTVVTTHRAYIGNQGDVTFNDSLILHNGSGSNNSEMYLNNGANSSNLYNGSIKVTCTDANSDGIRFGQSTGQGTLAAGQTVTVGAGGFVAGRLHFRNFTQLGNTPQNLTLQNAALLYSQDSDWGGNVNFVAGRQITTGTVYSGTAYLEKTGGNGDNSSGNNIFNDVTQIVHSGPAGYMRFANANPDTFLTDLSLINSGGGYLDISYNSTGNLIGGNLSITQLGNGLEVSVNSNASSTAIAGNVTVNNTTSNANNQIYVCRAGNLTIGGDVTLNNMSSGATSDFYLSNNGNGVLEIAGDLDMTNAGTGATTQRMWIGVNGSVTVHGDIDATNNTAATNSEIFFNYNGTGTYNGNISLESLLAGCDGVRFGQNGGSSTLAVGRTVSFGAGGFVSGDMRFRNFTQLGTTGQVLLATGTARISNQDSDWGGPVQFTAPRIYTTGTVYNDSTILEKTGTTDDNSPGGNVFLRNVYLTNSGSRQLLMGNGNPDSCMMNLTLVNAGTHNMYFAYNSAGNYVGGDLGLTNTGNAIQLDFGTIAASDVDILGDISVTNTSSATNSAVYIGNQGDLDINALTINNSPAAGNNGQVIVANNVNSLVNINGDCHVENNGSSTNSNVYIGNNGSINISGELTIDNSPNFTNGNAFVGDDPSSVVQISGKTTVINSGANSLRRVYLGNRGTVIFDDSLIITNESTANNSQVYLHRAAPSANQYNGHVVMESFNTGCDGILFGEGGGSGTLANGQTFSIGSAGFTDGYLQFRNVTQVGGTAQVIETTGNTRIINRQSSWDGNIDFRAPRHYILYSTFNGEARLEKTGAQNDASTGGNVFNDVARIVNSGTGYFMPTNNVGSDYNGDVYYIQSGTGTIRPTYNSVSNYAGDINIDYPTGALYFGEAGNGRVVLDGTAAQSINDLVGSGTTRFRDLQVANTGAGVTLNKPVRIVVELDLDQGVVYSDATNLLSMNNNATVSSVSDASHVQGPVEKLGNDAFVFPVGDQGVYQPIAMSAPASNAAAFRARYFNQNSAPTYDDAQIQASIHHISDCEYWTLERTNTASTVSVTLGFKPHTGSCSGVTNPATLHVAGWTGAIWADLGNSATTGTPTNGTVTATTVTNYYNAFTLANTTDYSTNPLPVELVDWNVEAANGFVDLKWSTATETNNDYFIIERSTNGIEFEVLDYVKGAGNSSSLLEYLDKDENPSEGANYYRLIQVDFDGTRTDHGIRMAQFNANENKPVIIYPNPSANGVLNMQNRSEETQTVSVYSESGQLLNTRVISAFETLNFSGFSSGIYVLRFSNGDDVSFARWVVQ